MPVPPPKMALLMLILSTDRSIRSELIGDLQEEFSLHYQQSAGLAKRWYWRQTITSLPKLIGQRMRSRTVRQYGFGMTVSLAAFVLVRAWDILLAQNLAGLVAHMDSDLPLFAARISYVAVMMAGFACAGGLVAKTTFCVEDGFLVNARRSLAPASLAILAPYLFAIIFSDDRVGFHPLILLALAVPSLIGGARYGASVMTGAAH